MLSWLQLVVSMIVVFAEMMIHLIGMFKSWETCRLLAQIHPDF